MIKNSKFRGLMHLLLISSCILILPVSNAQEEDSLIVYWDAEDVRHQTPSNSIRQIKRIANEEGHVTLWLTLKYPFNFYLENMTEQEQLNQQEEVRSQFAELLAPLIADGVVWEPDDGPFVRGPGCTVRATRKGVRKLVREDRLYQIVYMGM